MSSKNTLFSYIQDKSASLKLMPLNPVKDFIVQITHELYPYEVNKKTKGRRDGVIVKDDSGNIVYLKIEFLDLVIECLTYIFYYLGIGPQTAFLDTSNQSQTLVLSQGLLNSNKIPNERRIIDEAGHQQNTVLLKRYANVIAKLFRLDDLGKYSIGEDNALFVYHKNKQDFQLKILDFEQWFENETDNLYGDSDSSFYENLNLQQLVFNLSSIVKIKLGDNGMPLSGKERKVDNTRSASIPEAIEYGFNAGIKKFLERKGIDISDKELKKLGEVIMSADKEIENLKLQVSTSDQKYRALKYFFNYTLNNTNNDLFSFLFNNTDFQTLLNGTYLDSIDNIIIKAELHNFNADEIAIIKDKIELLNKTLIEKVFFQKEKDIKRHILDRNVNELFPSCSLSDTIILQLINAMQYRQTVLEPNLFEPLKQYEQSKEKVSFNINVNSNGKDSSSSQLNLQLERLSESCCKTDNIKTVALTPTLSNDKPLYSSTIGECPRL